MDEQEFILYQEQSFDSFCKTLIRNEGKDARKVIARREKDEISFSYLPDMIMSQFGREDSYTWSQVSFIIGDKVVIVEDEILAKALSMLPGDRRDIILLFYFLEKTDKQIGTAMNLSLDTVYYRRRDSLKRLRRLLEDLNSEK